MEYTQYDDKTLKHIHEVELMILKDFIEICEKYGLEYYAYGGTALGAIRHGGFIPWDDDIDLLMFREEYEKFLEVMEFEKTDKYEILNSDNYNDYFLCFSKMSLKDTRMDEFWNEKTSFNQGINIDIFVLDYVPSNKIKWFIYYQKCQFIKKFGGILQGVTNDYYISPFKKMIGHVLKIIFKVFHIDQKSFKKFYKSLSKYDSSSENVFDINAVCYNRPFPKKIFKPIKKVKFESIEVNVPNDVDTFLTITFGEDYMELPPEEERYNHVHTNIDFGKY